MRLLYALSAFLAVSLAAPITYDASLVEKDLKIAIAANHKIAATLKSLSTVDKLTSEFVNELRTQSDTVAKAIGKAAQDGSKSSAFGTASAAVAKVYCELSTSIKNVLSIASSKKAFFSAITSKEKTDITTLTDDFQKLYLFLAEVIVGQSETSEQNYAAGIGEGIDSSFKAFEKLI